MAVLVGRAKSQRRARAEKPRGDWDSIGAGTTCPRQNRNATHGNLKSYVNLLMSFKICEKKIRAKRMGRKKNACTKKL